MKRLYILTCTILATAMLSYACSKLPDTHENPDDDPTVIKIGNIAFTAKSGTFEGMQIPWREARINMDKSGDATLVIYLHGGSGKGDDNEKQIRGDEIGVLSSYLERKGLKAIFIAPQCPSDYSWGAKTNKPIAALIDSYGCSTLYGFGGSMGGTGMGSLVSTYPEKFTAAMIVAWNPAMAKVESMAKVPLRTVMGTADGLMDHTKVESFVAEVKAAGGNAIYELIEGWDHGKTCTLSYTDDRLDWVFSQDKKSLQTSVQHQLHSLFF